MSNVDVINHIRRKNGEPPLRWNTFTLTYELDTTEITPETSPEDTR